MNIGQTIRRMRRQKYPDLTMAEFAGLLKVSAVTMSKIETGRQQPTFPFLRKVAALLNMKVSEIIAVAEDTIRIT